MAEILDPQSAEKLKATLQQHPELYADEGLALLVHLLTIAKRPETKLYLQFIQGLFQHCRGLGVETVFAEFQLAAEEPRELAEIRQALAQPIRPQDMPRRIELCQQALCMVSRTARPQSWAALDLDLACSLAQTPRETWGRIFSKLFSTFKRR